MPPKGQTLRQHIDGLWPVLTRSTVEVEKWDSLLPLPKPYVVPGGRFREVYYWDSYFTMLGLAESGHWDKVEDMVANFAAEIDARAISPTATAPIISAVRSPLLLLYGEPAGDARWRPGAENLPAAAGEEYRYWMAGADALAPGSADKRAVRMADGALLNRYWDDNDTPRPESWLDDVKTAKSNPNRPATEIYRDLRSAAASGWDFSSRWMDNPQQLATIRTTSIVPVDLNALMFHLEKTLARASKASGTALALRSTMRWLTPASRPSRNTCGMIRGMVRRLRSRKATRCAIN